MTRIGEHGLEQRVIQMGHRPWPGSSRFASFITVRADFSAVQGQGRCPGGLYHFLRLPPLSGALTGSQAHCEANSHGKFVIREFWGGDQGCVRSDHVEPVRVGQHPANAGGGRSCQLNAETCLPSIWRWRLSDMSPSREPIPVEVEIDGAFIHDHPRNGIA